jgi:hypothetical protein
VDPSGQCSKQAVKVTLLELSRPHNPVNMSHL